MYSHLRCVLVIERSKSFLFPLVNILGQPDIISQSKWFKIVHSNFIPWRFGIGFTYAFYCNSMKILRKPGVKKFTTSDSINVPELMVQMYWNVSKWTLPLNENRLERGLVWVLLHDAPMFKYSVVYLNFITLFISFLVRNVPCWKHGGQRHLRSQYCPSIMWVLGIELQSSGQAALNLYLLSQYYPGLGSFGLD